MSRSYSLTGHGWTPDVRDLADVAAFGRAGRLDAGAAGSGRTVSATATR